jgi:hypothetical protein
LTKETFLVLESDTTIEQSMLHLRMNGWCVLDRVIPSDRVATIREECEAVVARHKNPNAPHAIGHVSTYINWDQSLAPYLADDRILLLVNALLGHNPRISFTSATINEPGNARGGWHADWPFNQKNAGHVPIPYPDAVMHLTTIWMLSPFSKENGGTLVVPGSHRCPKNPTGSNGVPENDPYPTETHACGQAGSVLIMDSRLWHATAPNMSPDPRVAVVVRYAPWWLNLEILRPTSGDRLRMVDNPGKTENSVPSLPMDVFDRLPSAVQPLFAHWTEPE